MLEPVGWSGRQKEKRTPDGSVPACWMRTAIFFIPWRNIWDIPGGGYGGCSALKEAVEYLPKPDIPRRRSATPSPRPISAGQNRSAGRRYSTGRRIMTAETGGWTGSLPARGPDSRSCSSCFFWCSGLPSAEQLPVPTALRWAVLVEDKLVLAVQAAGVPKMIYEPLIYGVYRVAAG